MLIVSGQGYASRAARRLLYELQQQGLKIFCMHDLDVYGMGIFRSMGRANDKFKHDIEIVDLGITPDDVENYGIKSERVSLSDKAEKLLNSLLYKDRTFFQPDRHGYSRRVELNAFTTEQLLQIIDDKLSGIASLPMLDISTMVKANEQKLKEYALFQLVRCKHEKMLSNITLPCLPSGTMTYHEMMKQLPIIESKLINELTAQIDRAI